LVLKTHLTDPSYHWTFNKVRMTMIAQALATFNGRKNVMRFDVTDEGVLY